MWPPDLITTGERPSLSNVDSTDTDERTLRYQFYSFKQLMSRTTSIPIIRLDASVAFGRARCISVSRWQRSGGFYTFRGSRLGSRIVNSWIRCSASQAA